MKTKVKYMQGLCELLIDTTICKEKYHNYNENKDYCYEWIDKDAEEHGCYCTDKNMKILITNFINAMKEIEDKEIIEYLKRKVDRLLK